MSETIGADLIADLQQSFIEHDSLWRKLAEGDRDLDFAAQLDEYQSVLAFVTIYERLTARLDRQITLIARLLEDRDVMDARLADLADRLTIVERQHRPETAVVGCD